MLAVLAVLVVPDPAAAVRGGVLDASRSGAVSSFVAAARSLFLVEQASPARTTAVPATPAQRLVAPGPAVLLQVRCVVTERLHDLPPPC